MDVAPYNAQQANIDAAWAASKTQIANQRTLLGSSYGGTFDPTTGKFSVDNTSQQGAVQSLRNNQGLDLLNNDEAQSTRGIGKSGFGLGGQRENLMRFSQRQSQFDLLNQAQQSYMGTTTDETNAQLTHDTNSTTLGISKAAELAAENSWLPAPSPAVPGAANSPIPGIGSSVSSYLPPATVAAQAAASKKSVVGKTGNSGIHAM